MRNMIRYMVLTLLVGVSVACSDTNNGGNSGGDADNTTDVTSAEDAASTKDSTSVEDATRDPDGPEILDFSVTPERLTETDTGGIEISVSITHPQGFAEIGGGKILDEDGVVYATFAGAAGTFSAVMTWSGIQGKSRIDFEENQSRTFIAEFFDAANRRTRQSFTVELHCDGAPACNGVCGMLACIGDCAGLSCGADGCASPEQLIDDRLNCGTCGHICDSGQICAIYQCECGPGTEWCEGTACADLQSDVQNCGGCGQSCASGEVCSSGECAKPGYSGALCSSHHDCGSGQCNPSAGVSVCAVSCGPQQACDSEELECLEGAGTMMPFPNCYRPCTDKNNCESNETCINLFQKTGEGPDRRICMYDAGF